MKKAILSALVLATALTSACTVKCRFRGQEAKGDACRAEIIGCGPGTGTLAVSLPESKPCKPELEVRCEGRLVFRGDYEATVDSGVPQNVVYTGIPSPKFHKVPVIRHPLVE